MAALDEIPLSIHAWQGDDVTGFEHTDHALTGGCQVTGNYPGRARNSVELRADLDMALSLIPDRCYTCCGGNLFSSSRGGFPVIHRGDFPVRR